MLEVRELNAFYGQSHILHNVSLGLADGAGTAVIGLNGMGKSTLLKAIMSAGPVTRGGSIALDGKDLAKVTIHDRARRGLALVPEDRRIYPHLTVLENLALAGYASIKGRTPYTPDEVLQIFPMLQPLAGRKGFQLSGGEQQLVAVARALLSRPRFLLLDEPTEGLAPLIVDLMEEKMMSLRRREKVGLLLAEQNVDFARACTESLVILNVGRAVFTGSWDEFDSDPSIRRKFLSL